MTISQLAQKAYTDGLCKPCAYSFTKKIKGELYCCGLTAATVAVIGKEKLLAHKETGDSIQVVIMRALAIDEAVFHGFARGFDSPGLDVPTDQSVQYQGAFKKGRALRMQVLRPRGKK